MGTLSTPASVRRARSKALLLLVFAGCSTVAHGGGFVTGNDLYAQCEKSDAIRRVECAAYVTGIADVLAAGNVVNGGYKACFETSMTKGQLADTVLKFLGEHPEKRHLMAIGLVAEALWRAFPCPK